MSGVHRSSRQSTSSSASSSSPPPLRRSHTRGSRSPPAEGTEEVFQTIVQNRKSWKTARSGETVWPPELEGALLEGLASYQPDDSRETRLLGRFPMRNRIISDYIFNKTGKRRTAKQVGSRLQQLRDTCGGEQLLKLLSPVIPQTVSAPEADSSADIQASSSCDPRSVISIDILPDGVACPCSLPSCRFSDAIESVQSLSFNERLKSNSSGFDSSSSSHPRPLRAIDPTITFTANSEVEATSFFTVYHDTSIVYSQNIPLTFSTVPENSNGRVLVSTALVPGYWENICSSSDPTRYSIDHQVQGVYASSVIFSALYKFVYPPGMTARGAPMHVLDQLHVPISHSSSHASSSSSHSPHSDHSYSSRSSHSTRSNPASNYAAFSPIVLQGEQQNISGRYSDSATSSSSISDMTVPISQFDSYTNVNMAFDSGSPSSSSQSSYGSDSHVNFVGPGVHSTARSSTAYETHPGGQTHREIQRHYAPSHHQPQQRSLYPSGSDHYSSRTSLSPMSA